MTELMQHIANSLPEELEGVIHYSDMAKMADEVGKHGEAALFRDMAREEFCHAKHLKAIIHEKPIGPAPADHAQMVEKWKEAETAINGF